MRMRTTFQVAALAVAAALGVAGCGDSATEVVIPLATGQWSGTFQNSPTVTATFNATFVEGPSGEITGSGSVSVTGGSLAFSVESGAHAHPSFSVTLGAAGTQDFTFSGVMSPDGNRIDGRLDGSGFDGNTLVLLRQ